MKKYYYSLGLLLIIIGSISLYFLINDQETKIRKEIELANYCEVQDDCVVVNSKCPFDCFVFVNKNESSRISELIDSYPSKCIYGCIAVVPELDCVEGKCIWDKDKNVLDGNDTKDIDSFEKCVEVGNPVMESYPRKCRANGITFTEEIGNELELQNLIRIDHPRPGEAIESPLVIKGEARGAWFFEGSFPVILTNWDGLIIAESYASSEGEWMTEDFVRFRAELEFDATDQLYKRGSLILKKDNPSGLPEYDNALEIPIIFK